MLQATVHHPIRSKALRLFFAIYPPKRVRKQIAQVQDSFAATTPRPVAEENLHLTLIFLDRILPDRYDCYTRAAATLASINFKLTLNIFGHFNKMSLCWLAPVQPPQALFTLRQKLGAAIANCGYSDRRDFKPHVTLFRKAAKLTLPKTPASIEWHVNEFVLMQSVQKNEQSSYLILEKYHPLSA